MKQSIVLILAGLVIALPFVFRRTEDLAVWRAGDPMLVVISPHNEAIRYEFARAFDRWHRDRFGQPVRIDWRTIGGTSEIARYLESEMQAAFQAWWTGPLNRRWPRGGAAALTHHWFDETDADPQLLAIRHQLRATDDPDAFTVGLDVFFGGGEYDHSRAFAKGLIVPAWPNGIPESLVKTDDGYVLIPESIGGERWRGQGFVGAALSTFGIVYNLDRLDDLAVVSAPATWDDLVDPLYIRQLGVADPTKSGSIAKAFEMMIQQKIAESVAAAGYREPFKAVDPDLDPDYAAAVSQGWIEGINLVRRIGANARYFTDSASKVPIDVSSGNATVGLAIDFYGRYQAETSRAPDGTERMRYVTPLGGSSVSCDPISLVRGAPNRALAVRFIEFVLSEDGQRLWNYRPGTPGGPEKYALRRLPIRRDFYPSDDSFIQARYLSHAPHTSDDLGDPAVNPYHVASTFTYVPEWTSRHFGIHRDLIRAMCMDAGDELRAAWLAIRDAGNSHAATQAMDALTALPAGLTWRGAIDPQRYPATQRMETMRDWVLFFRAQYRKARRLAGEVDDGA